MRWMILFQMEEQKRLEKERKRLEKERQQVNINALTLMTESIHVFCQFTIQFNSCMLQFYDQTYFMIKHLSYKFLCVKYAGFVYLYILY